MRDIAASSLPKIDDRRLAHGMVVARGGIVPATALDIFVTVPGGRRLIWRDGAIGRAVEPGCRAQGRGAFVHESVYDGRRVVSGFNPGAIGL